ncbi:hypothetical protein JYU34_010263 [Plutella xylostella]|uniref:Uncharacterized protein n=1 Tax=Plutella xylostella TaxID=51655 RepID=A0ABQ7QI18_PLUXY|nr:hypothetical protein JYU34_010263 [Plutella xylostella]
MLPLRRRRGSVDRCDAAATPLCPCGRQRGEMACGAAPRRPCGLALTYDAAAAAASLWAETHKRVAAPRR